MSTCCGPVIMANCFDLCNQAQVEIKPSHKRKYKEHDELLGALFGSKQVENANKKRKGNFQKIKTQLINSLPDELFNFGILSYLEFDHLISCATVCKRWYSVVGKTPTAIDHYTILRKSKNENNYMRYIANVTRYFRNVQELSLREIGFETFFNPSKQLYLETVLGNIDNIRTLEISGHYITESACLAFSRNPKPNLTELTLVQCAVSDVGFTNLSLNSVLSNVRKLNISLNDIGENSCTEIAKISKLQYLDLSFNSIGSIGAKNLGCLSLVEYLDLSQNNIGSVGLQAITEKCCPNMRICNLSKNNIEATGFKNIGNFENLQQLDISNNVPSSLGASFISKNLKHLTVLRLNECKIDGPAMVLLSEGCLNNLEELYLDGNLFGDEGCLPFQSSMFSNLKKLRLGRNMITCYGCNYLSSSESLKSLEDLNLSFNRIRANGINFLANSHFQSLTTLILVSNGLTNQTISLFKGAAFSKLTTLFLDGNRFLNPEALKRLTILPNLKCIDFFMK